MCVWSINATITDVVGHKATQRRQDDFSTDDWSEMIFIDFLYDKDEFIYSNIAWFHDGF